MGGEKTTRARGNVRTNGGRGPLRVILLALLACTSEAEAADSGDVDSCYRVSLEQPILAIDAANWRAESEEIVVRDPQQLQEFTFLVTGKLATAPVPTLAGMFENAQARARSADALRVRPRGASSWEPGPSTVRIEDRYYSLQAAPIGVSDWRGVSRTDLGLSSRGAAEPVALFSQDDLLYVLTRADSSAEGVAWRLVQTKPRDEELHVLGSLTLPTSSRAIRILPTVETWVVFELPSDSTGVETARHDEVAITGMLVLPTRWIKDSTTSPLYERGAAEIRCNYRESGTP